MSNREKFEEWYSGTYRETIHILPNGQYASLRQQHSWDAWQARVPEGYVVVPVEPTYEMWSELSRHLGRYMQLHDRYCPKTLKKYFDRFIGEPPEWLSKEVGSWDSDHAFATADLPVFIYKAMIEAA